MNDRKPSDAEMIGALRRFGWLRDDGDGERLHMTRETLPRMTRMEPETLIPKNIKHAIQIARATKGSDDVYLAIEDIDIKWRISLQELEAILDAVSSPCVGPFHDGWCFSHDRALPCTRQIARDALARDPIE